LGRLFFSRWVSGWSKEDLVQFYLQSKVMDDESLLGTVLTELRQSFGDTDKDNLLPKVRELVRVYRDLKAESEIKKSQQRK